MASACAEHATMPTALARLTPRQRACLLLRARDGFSIDEIAHVLGVSPGKVKVTLRRVKEQSRTADGPTVSTQVFSRFLCNRRR